MDYSKYSYGDYRLLHSLIKIAKQQKEEEIEFKGEKYKIWQAEIIEEELEDYFKDRHK